MNDLRVPPPVIYDLTTVGEAFVELHAENTALPEASNFTKRITGSAALISIYYSMLGGKANCIASVGADAHGTFVQNTLRQYKVNVSTMQFSREHQTSLLFTSRLGHIIQSAYYRLSEWQLHNTKEHVVLAQGSRIVHGSGFCLWQHPARHSVFEILRLSKKFDSTTVLQPFFEPALWRNRSDALTTIKKTLQFADILTPTLDDAENLFGKASREDHLKSYHDMGAKTVIMTMGKEGALVSDGVKVVRVPAVEAEVVDPAGVHDAWHAGLYYAINNNKPLANATYFANAVAAWVLSREGSLVELPAPGEISQTLLDKAFEDV
ncbi:MAG: PfkB family carbohydrate kinase [Bacteroidota bacterium]